MRIGEEGDEEKIGTVLAEAEEGGAAQQQWHRTASECAEAPRRGAVEEGGASCRGAWLRSARSDQVGRGWVVVWVRLILMGCTPIPACLVNQLDLLRYSSYIRWPSSTHPVLFFIEIIYILFFHLTSKSCFRCCQRTHRHCHSMSSRDMLQIQVVENESDDFPSAARIPFSTPFAPKSTDSDSVTLLRKVTASHSFHMSHRNPI